MKRFLVPVFGAVLVIALAVQGPAASSRAPKVLEFDTMGAVVGPFVGADNPIRGVNGGGLPWQIAEGRGELTGGGKLDVEVRGLVLLDGAPVPPERRGTNPIPNFRAIVSCLTIVDGDAATANVATGPLPATTTGDSEIQATVALPRPCLAPIVFVGTSATTWFTVTSQA